MKIPFAITATVLNLVLTGWMIGHHPAPQAQILTAAPLLQSPAAVVPANYPIQPAAVLAPTIAPQAFHWSQLESPDYRTYVRNLRAIGCPKATIRDIITADLHALYRDRRRQACCLGSRDFWRYDYGLEVLSQTNLARLDAEENAVLAALLGPEVADPLPAVQTVRLVTGTRLCAELEPKRAALEEWSKRFESSKSALLAIADQRDLTDNEMALLRMLEAEQEQALTALLTPDERTEFDVRNSPSAQSLRQTLLGLEVSEQEFRTLLVARQDFDSRLASAVTEEDHITAHQAYQEFVANLLDAERYASFERAQTPEFQEFFTQGIARGLDASTIEAQWTEAHIQLASNLGEP